MRILHDKATDVVYLMFRDVKSHMQESRGGGAVLLDLGRKDPKTKRMTLNGVEILGTKYSLSRILADIADKYKEPRVLMFDPAWRSKLNYQRRIKKAMKRTTSCPGTRMYVLVNREALSPVQWGIQASHAVATFMDKYASTSPGRLKRIKQWARRHKTMTFLACTQKQRIELFERNRKGPRFAYADFFEPDLGGVWTATAFEPITKEEGADVFSGLVLL